MATKSVLLPLAGLLAGAAIVGVVWLLVGGSSGNSVDTKPLTTPRSFGTLEPYAVADDAHGTVGRKDAARNASWNRKSSALLSDAYGGAAATVTSYADAKLDSFATLLVVRAASPQPFEPYEDAAVEGMVRPEYEVRQLGDVFCSLYNSPTYAPATAAPDSVTILSCQRSGPNLTVSARLSGPLSHNPAKVATFIDAAFEQIT